MDRKPFITERQAADARRDFGRLGATFQRLTNPDPIVFTRIDPDTGDEIALPPVTPISIRLRNTQEETRGENAGLVLTEDQGIVTFFAPVDVEKGYRFTWDGYACIVLATYPVRLSQFLRVKFRMEQGRAGDGG